MSIDKLIDSPDLESVFIGMKTHKNFWEKQNDGSWSRVRDWMANYSSRQIRRSIVREDTGLCCASRAWLWRRKRIGDKVDIITNNDDFTGIDIHHLEDLMLAQAAIDIRKIYKMNNKIENLKASIIVRTKNEDRWIGQCLSAIEKQSYENKEVILVDNNSTDETINIASSFKDVKIVKYSPKGIFKPGESINLGIKASTGDYIVIISGHCIPTNKKWLSNLLRNLKDKNIAGVYGRQEPLSFTSSLDKRDLVITLDLIKKYKRKILFFIMLIVH